MADLKILFTGPMGAGKTTAIAAVSETPPVNTDVASTEEEAGKPTTTVGLDFGTVTLDGGERLRLFGTPGQARFDFLWPILGRDALGIVILLDARRSEPAADLATCVEGLRLVPGGVPCTVGVGRLADGDTHLLADCAEALHRRGLVVPVLAVDVRRRDDVLLLLDTLLAQVEADLEPHA